MAVIVCPNGHVYNSGEFSSCPFCEGENNVFNYEERIMNDFGEQRNVTGDFSKGNRTYRPDGDGGNVSGGIYKDYENNPKPDGGSVRGQGGTFKPEGNSVRGQGGTFKPEGYPDSRVDDNRKQTISIGSESVVGWLVCIEGVNKGKDYRLYAKINMIGRSPENDVYIKGDDYISRRAGNLDYDPRHNEYHLMRDSSCSSHIRLNGMPVRMPTELKAYDVIEMGMSKFLFIPLCNDQFQWDLK